MTAEDTSNSFLALGMMQLMLGLFSWVIAGAQLVSHTAYSYIGYGFWCGLFFIIAGSVAVAHGSTAPNPDLVRADAAMSWIATVFAVAQIGFGSVSLLGNIFQQTCGECTQAYYNYCSPWIDDTSYCLDEYGYVITLFMSGTIIALGFIEFCMAFATACIACCCSPSTKNNRVSSVDDVQEHVRNPSPPPAFYASTAAPLDTEKDKPPSTHSRNNVNEISFADSTGDFNLRTMTKF